jgi:hypothetical protein
LVSCNGILWTVYCCNVEEREEGKVKGTMVGRTRKGKGILEKGENKISFVKVDKIPPVEFSAGSALISC